MLVPALRGRFHFLVREDVLAAKPARGTRTPTYPERLTRHLNREPWPTGLRVLLWQEMSAGGSVQTVATDHQLCSAAARRSSRAATTRSRVCTRMVRLSSSANASLLNPACARTMSASATDARSVAR